MYYIYKKSKNKYTAQKLIHRSIRHLGPWVFLEPPDWSRRSNSTGFKICFAIASSKDFVANLLYMALR